MKRKTYWLTPREIEICNMVKSDITSKEISKLLNISPQTIVKHRKNIRKKLGISNKNINLTSFLHEL
jgi:DNA-binding CsgD family transcriptional regulator